MLIRDEINNAPMFTVLNTSKISSDSVRFIPGQRIKVTQHDEIKPLYEGRATDVSSIQISQILKAYGEEYLGSVDQLFRNATNKGGGKTLGEIEQGVAVSQYIASLDILNWLDTLKKVYTKVFNVMRERLVNPLIINGEVITREDFNFVPDISPAGSLEMADKQLQAQKALARMNLVRQAYIDGLATKENVYEAYKDYFEADGVHDSNQYLTDPKVILQENITMMEQKAQQLNGLIAQQNQVIEEGEKGLDKIQGEMVKRKRNAQAEGQEPRGNPQGNGELISSAR
jgi:hypothetical protein